MTRFTWGRAVHFILVAGIALSVGACGGPRRAAKKYCKALEKCSLAEFNDAYSSRKDCIDESLDDYDDLRDDEGEICAQAYLDFGHCAAEAWLQDCDNGDIERECDREFDDYLDECF